MQKKIFVLAVCALLIVSSATIQVSADVNDCKATDTNCITCDTTDNTKCATCKDNYYVNDQGICTQCSDAHCKTCSKDACSACNDGYHQVSGSCVANTCKDTDKNCITCDTADNTKCATCKDNYYINDQGICTQCSDAHCKTCSATACSACNDGYHQVSGSCVANTCEDANCANCDTTTNPGTCTKCNNGFYLDNNKCTQCTETNCKTCSATACSACNDGFYLEKDKCVACNATLTSCITCTNAKTCTKCADKFKVENGKCVSSGGNDVAAYSVTYFVTFALLLMTAAIVAQFA